MPDINDKQGTRNAGDTPQLIADRIDRAFRLVRIEHVVLSTVAVNLRSNRRPSTENAHNEDRRNEQRTNTVEARHRPATVVHSGTDRRVRREAPVSEPTTTLIITVAG